MVTGMSPADTVMENKRVVWRQTPWFWLSLLAMVPLLVVIYYHGLDRLLVYWVDSEEYSHGPLIPFISLFLIWQKKDKLEQIRFDGSWAGFAVVCLGIALFFLGEMSAITIITQYSFVITLAGMAYSLMGWQGLKEIWVAFLFLIFMIPLPAVIFQGLSQELQLISSSLGVVLIRFFNISVYLEGNVIDLGNFKLQVVEACSGLRYLFPLMSLAFIGAYFFKEAFWKRAVIFLSSIPITVFMNSFRIGVIGVLVDRWGPTMAAGFLHYFEGWVIFMICLVVLVAEMWLLVKIGGNKRPMREVFGFEFPALAPMDAQPHHRTVPKVYLWTMGIIVLAAVFSLLVAKRVEIPPQREVLSSYPMQLGQWQGKRIALEQIYLDQLKLDDYLLSDYVDGNRNWVNLYVAYYGSQRKGHSIHSPRACLPGGGWEIKSLTQKNLDEIVVNGMPLAVNRTVIQMGDNKQLVYYWFKQRDRIITNEYMVKWYLFWDALTRNRTDGALVRVTTPVRPDENIEDADSRLISFVKLANAPLKSFVPD